MTNEKTIAILLFVISGVLAIFSIGLYVWAGIGNIADIGGKVGCSVLLDLMIAGLTCLGIKIMKK